jgi:nucleolar MIF4G domain-containing protein 1
VPKQKLKTTALERLVNKSTVKPRKLASTGPRNREEEEEDAYIAYLESKLGYAGGGSRRKDDAMDGLGGMLHCIFYLEMYLTVLPQICLTSQKIS